jgi:hypothetical protein
MAKGEKKLAAKLTIEDYKKENAKLKRVLTVTADKLHETLNVMQPLVAESKDDNFIRAYETGRNHVRKNFNLGTELKRKTKKGKKLSDDDIYFESLPASGEKSESLFQMMRTTYKDWIINRLNVVPIWEGREFAALKTLEKFFLNVAILRGKKHQEETGEVITQEMIKEAANTSWGNLLTGLLSDKVTDFLKSQKKLSQIQYNLTNIIDQLKNGTGKQGNGKVDRRKGLEEAEREIALATGVEQPIN